LPKEEEKNLTIADNVEEEKALNETANSTNTSSSDNSTDTAEDAEKTESSSEKLEKITDRKIIKSTFVSGLGPG